MGATAGQGHVPVLLARCLELLAPAVDRANPVHVDATVGLGGHAEAMLAAHPNLTVVGLDRDPVALSRSRARLAPYGDRVRLEHAVFDQLSEVLDRLALPTVDSVLFDLGVSSMQLDEEDRGFAFRHDGPLDMRMHGEGESAADVVNEYPVEELAAIIFRYGEERHSRRIARRIAEARESAPILTTKQLAEVVAGAYPPGPRREHPARRTFQALRIHVNDELGALREGLEGASRLLVPGGRLVVLSYHSLEDRIVKRFLLDSPRFEVVTKKPITASEEEVASNPRARAAKLRAGKKVAA